MIERNARWTAGSALLLVAVAFVVSIDVGTAAVAGASVACLSAFLVQRLAIAFAKAGDRAKPFVALLLVGKTGVVLGASAFLLSTFRLNGAGFALGVSALVMGAMGAAIQGFLQQQDPAPPSGTLGPASNGSSD